MKKVLALGLAAVMALGLCACNVNITGGDQEENKKVTAALLKEVTMTSVSDEETVTMKAVLEYDKDYYLISAKTYEDDELRVETTYAKDMNKPLTQVNYDEDGDLSSRWEYTYDDDGNELTNFYYNSDNEQEWGTVNTYDDDGNILSEKHYTEEELQAEYLYTYDTDGKLVEKHIVWAHGDEDWTYYTYDDHGNPLTERNSRDGEEYSATTYENTYDGDKLVEVKTFVNGELDAHSKYDAEGNEILSVNYYDDEETFRTETTYEDGKPVKRVSYNYGEETYRMEYTYNDDGELTERFAKYTDGDTARMVFSYDDDGVLTGMKAYDGDGLEGEYVLAYEQVTVSREVAKRIEAVRSMLNM